MAKVSVIVPVYNAEKTLERCLDSILGQTLNDIELVLVNDGSQDSSLKICEEYAVRDRRIKVFSQENRGPSTARNTGIDNASGDYLYFVDSDDYIANDTVEKLYTAAVSSGAEVTICGLYYVKNGVEKEHEITYEPGTYEGKAAREIAIDLLSNHSHRFLPPYSVIRLIRRDILEQPRLRYTEGIIRSEDYLFTTELHFRIEKLCLITDQPLYYYIDSDTSITNSFVVSYWQMVRRINEILLSRLPESDAVKRGLDTVLIYRSQIAFSNASRAGNIKDFNAELTSILRDKTLFTAIDALGFREGVERFKAYYLFLRLRLKPLIRFRYYMKYRQNRRRI